jgi:MFS superfamily sulfate permease-like transporter
LRVLRNYDPSWLSRDVFAGLVLTTMLVPVGIAYAEASGVPGIYGLYATIVPLLAYALFGPSRILVLGPDSALAAVILAVVLPHSAGDPQRAIALASMMAIVSGVVCVAAGFARLGFITELLSKPIRYGYMNGIALTVMLSQIPKLFGFKVNAAGPLRQAWGIVQQMLAGNTNLVTLAIGGSTLGLIVMLKRYPRVPGILLAVIAATLVVAISGVYAHAGVSVIGPLPHGLPTPAVPFLNFDDLVPVLEGGLAVALVSFADTSVLSRTYAARLRTPVDPNQEMVGLGVANLAAGFFQGFPISSSSSRTPVAEAAGSKTQLTGVVGALAPLPAQHGARCRCHRLRYRTFRSRRLAPHLPHPALGVLVVDGLLRGRGGARRHSGHRARDRNRRNRVSMGRVASAFRRARTRRRRQGISR